MCPLVRPHNHGGLAFAVVRSPLPFPFGQVLLADLVLQVPELPRYLPPPQYPPRVTRLQPPDHNPTSTAKAMNGSGSRDTKAAARSWTSHGNRRWVGYSNGSVMRVSIAYTDGLPAKNCAVRTAEYSA